MPLRLDTAAAGFEAAFVDFLAGKRESAADVQDAVAAIIADVRKRGDDAVVDYTNRFDRQSLTAATLKVTEAEISDAHGRVAEDTVAALHMAAARIKAFHSRQMPKEDRYVDGEGVLLGARWTPLSSVGVYVPGGLAAYPSSVLMNTVPARVAGVGRVVMTVPAPDGVLNPLVLVAARAAGVDEVYKVGGAQAVAALAHGTATIRPVDKIVGPGNAYVAAAKRQVFGTVGIDMVAGPSEILVVADRDNDPVWIAVDLLSQAEHDEVAQAILVTDDAAFAQKVAAAVEDELTRAPRADIARASWRDHGAIILVRSMEEVPAIVNRVAPEHLELAVAEPEAMMARIHHAGAIFLGRYTPEAIGDYVAGPNHVLPTARSARFSSGLNLLDFMKRTTFVGCNAASLSRIGPAAVTLAHAEGLEAHARSISLRLES
ncbi:histidinol dehydrogenase [Radicibacter daui]|uniref:histidinol dehydrogenase n=1 Tax=Radicibacter daui TaxID=3064829 RepID=UPI004046D30E